MNLIINGTTKECTDGTDLQSLIQSVCLTTQHVIAEVNSSIINKELWPTITLKDKDQIELITFVGGG